MNISKGLMLATSFLFILNLTACGGKYSDAEEVMDAQATAMENYIDAMEQAGVRSQVKVLVGGAPITKTYADEVGADGYSESAAGAVALARKAMTQNAA